MGARWRAWKSYTSRTEYRIADINTVRYRLADNRFFSD